MTNLLDDLRFPLRQLRRSPGFALTAILTLALGIAANVIVFGVLDALILRPLDLPHADRLMTLSPNHQAYPIASFPEVRDVRDDNTVFSSVSAWGVQNVGLEANGVTRPIWAYHVSGQYFETVAIQPFLGRLLQRGDDDHTHPSQVAVLSWPAWKNNFAADPAIVGKTVRLNKHPYTIVGVAPQGFYGTEKFLQPELFVPMVNVPQLYGWTDVLDSRQTHPFWSLVRLKDGITPAQAQADLNTIASRITRQFPKEEEGLTLKLVRPGLMGDFFGAPARRFLAAVMGLAFIVLLAACANLGSLFAARTADSAREIAIRMAIGSTRWRVVRQVLIEAFLISILGGVCACALSWLTLTGLANWHPPTEYPFRFVVQPRPSLLVMAFFTSIFAGVLFGCMPLRQIFRTDPNDVIKGGCQTSAGRRWTLRDILLAAQIALCCVTVTAAFVALRGLNKSLTMNFGFNPKHVVLTKFELTEGDYSGDAAGHFQRRLLDRVQQLPGVESAAYANDVPLSQGAGGMAVFAQQTTDLRPSNKLFQTYIFEVSPGYFTAAQTPLLEGRDVSFTDTPNTPLVAVVNQQFARKLFHTEHAVGRYFKNADGHLVQITGIVADGKYLSLSEDQDQAAFLPISQEPNTHTSLLVRTRAGGPPVNDTATAVRKLIRDLDPAIPIRQSSEWTNQLGLTLFPSQIATVALGLFGAFGLLLSITGTFGLASYTVSKRLRELSIRVALGASSSQIVSVALGRMLILIASGSVIGMLLGVAASRVLSAVVYQATAQDPFVLGAVALTILLTGTLSVAGPVRRALQADPAALLREQ